MNPVERDFFAALAEILHKRYEKRNLRPTPNILRLQTGAKNTMTTENAKTRENAEAMEISQTKIEKSDSKARGWQIVSRMRNLLLFLPNLVGLCVRLLGDARVSVADKALFAGAIVYAVVPLDLIPDVLPLVGQVDDVYLIALALLRLVNRSDEKVVRELWTGGGDVVQLANSIASIAPMLLPKRVNRVLTERVEMRPDKVLQAVKKLKQPNS